MASSARVGWKSWTAVAAMGAAVCTLGDYFHAASGVLSYPNPVLGLQAWWVPPLFALATVACVLSAALFGGPRGWRAEKAPSLGRVAVDVVAFFVAYASTSAFHDLPNTLLLVLGAWWIARAVSGLRPWLIAHCLLLAVSGALCEAALSAAGLFSYGAPDLVGVPRWLPALYLHAGIASARLWIYLARAGGRPTS